VFVRGPSIRRVAWDLRVTDGARIVYSARAFVPGYRGALALHLAPGSYTFRSDERACLGTCRRLGPPGAHCDVDWAVTRYIPESLVITFRPRGSDGAGCEFAHGKGDAVTNYSVEQAGRVFREGGIQLTVTAPMVAGCPTRLAGPAPPGRLTVDVCRTTAVRDPRPGGNAALRRRSGNRNVFATYTGPAGERSVRKSAYVAYLLEKLGGPVTALRPAAAVEARTGRPVVASECDIHGSHLRTLTRGRLCSVTFVDGRCEYWSISYLTDPVTAVPARFPPGERVVCRGWDPPRP
jgi:hypothetical protein